MKHTLLAITLCAATLCTNLAAAPADATLKDADQFFARGEFSRAYLAYQNVVAATPHVSSALLGLGTIELYRNQLTLARQHLAAALAVDPSNVMAKARLQTLDDRLGRSGTYHIVGTLTRLPFILDPLPILTVVINGHKAKMLLDTGAPGLGISTAFAARLGLTSKIVGKGVFAGGRTAQVRAATIREIHLGALTVTNVPAQIFPGVPGDGIIGTGFLAHFLSTVDYAHKQLLLAPISDSRGFEARAVTTHATVVPMVFVGDHFIFARASVNAAPRGWFNIDTGGPFGIQMTKDALGQAGIVTDPKKAQLVNGPGGDTHIIPFDATSVSVGSDLEKHVDGVYFADGDQYGIFPFTVWGTLSQSFFLHDKVTFDFSAMRIVIEK